MLQEVKMKSCISPPPQREFTQAGGGEKRVDWDWNWNWDKTAAETTTTINSKAYAKFCLEDADEASSFCIFGQMVAFPATTRERRDTEREKERQQQLQKNREKKRRLPRVSSYRILSSIGTKTDFCLCALRFLLFASFFGFFAGHKFQSRIC